ncbi:MAG: iron-sulfur cluster assembly scaffold protein [Nitrospinota bacterium]|nr:MAG: iron-sulfur cluster assembly scaffold protein [Nitrospinota bacterium]
MEEITYTREFLDHFKNPRNTGEIKDPDGMATVSNPVCGDTMKLFLRIEGDRITEIRYKTFGCEASIAASSVLTTLVKSRSLAEATALTPEEISQALGGLPRVKQHAADLVIEALEEALDDYRARRGKGKS